jgi:hypothetical protein
MHIIRLVLFEFAHHRIVNMFQSGWCAAGWAVHGNEVV